MLRSLAALTVTLALTACSGSDPEPGPGRVSAFHLGGSEISVAGSGVDANLADVTYVGQVSVIAVLPDRPTGRAPIVMLPGFGIAVTSYLETPDSREGWAMDAIRRGHPVYLVEPALSARAGISPDQSIRLFSWGSRNVWRRWGIGEQYPVPFDDGQFPVEYWNDVVKSFAQIQVGDATARAMIAVQNDDTVAGVKALLERIGPSILLVHSASGTPGFEVARKNSAAVLAVVNVEPVGCPTQQLEQWEGIPVLSVFGDHMEVRPQMPPRQDNCQTTVDYLQAHGTAAEMFALPQMGIRGNSHLMMDEMNSSELMAMILDWLEENV
jgi:hypothetical protein